ncbi:MAG: PASTA domain-containing protein [Thermoleophilia bacterium]|nr:PASTA domain-containing protein [Thermoleophilia bacterium]
MELPRRRPLGGLLAAAAGIVVLAVGGILAFTTLTREAALVTVPSLVGLTAQQATAAIDQTDLGLLTKGGDLDDDPQTVVTAQDPGAGATVRAGSTVHIWFGRPPQPVTVPDLTGTSRQAAQEALRGAGLYLGTLEEDFSGGIPGMVTRQHPPAGTTLAAGGTVDLWVAAAASTRVPDFAGMSRSQAEAAAAAAGIELQVLSEVTDEVAPNTVLEQSPQAGSRVEPEARVVVLVNSASGTPAGDTQGGSAAPTAYQALARIHDFPVLYPTYLPAGLGLQPSPDNPRQVVSATGEEGFEVLYLHAQNAQIRLSLLEGDWFDVGLDADTTLDVLGSAGALSRVGDTVRLTWRVGTTGYGVSAQGLTDDEVVRFAEGLRPVEQRNDASR